MILGGNLMSRSNTSRQDPLNPNRASHSVSWRDELGTASPFTGKVRKKPTILMITDDLTLADEISSHADKQAIMIMLYWSLENMMFGYEPSCDVMIISERIEQQLAQPAYARLLRRLANVPTVVCIPESTDATGENPGRQNHTILSPLNQVFFRCASGARGQEIIALSLEAYHKFHDDHRLQNLDVKAGNQHS